MTCPPFTIVGVVGDVKYQGLNGNGESMYVPAAQNWSPSFDGYFLIYPGRRQVPSPLRALIDLLRTQRASIRRSTDPGMVFPGTLAKV